MKLLTFLGTGNYQETTYCWGDCCHTSCYCPAALVHFFHPVQTLVVVTEASRAKHFDPLTAELAAITQVTPVPIPEGKREGELWAIFDALTDQFAEGDELIVDLTHGFRSLPFLSFLAVAYLRVAKRVNVAGVYYGAFDARDQDANRTPVFDLTPFVTLLDWTIATDRFIVTGDARMLAELMRQAELTRTAGEAAAKIRDVASALFITSPIYVAKYSRVLDINLKKAETESSQKMPPFSLLVERIRQSYASFGAEKLLQDPTRLREHLRVQLKMIRWYMENQHIPQGLTLAREWLVTLTGYALGQEIVLGANARQPIENALNAYMKRDEGLTDDKIWPAELEPRVQALSFAKTLVDLWRDTANLRNAIDHGFHDKSPQEPGAFVKKVQQLLPDLEELARLALQD